MPARIRKLVVQVDETRIEMGQTVDPPTRRALAIAVIENPYAGRYEADLGLLMDIGAELGGLLGEPLRAAVGKGAALVPSAKKQGGLGTTIDVPLGHKDAAFVRSHFDAIEARVSDAPRANEIVVAVAVTASGRPLARVGGLQKHEIKGQDGLR